jgi:hypothetical protein
MGMTLITTILPVGEVTSVENTDYQRAGMFVYIHSTLHQQADTAPNDRHDAN